VKGIRVERPGEVASAWDEALSHDGIVVFEAITDPEVPPLPPHIKFEQAKELAKALPGDPHRGRIVKESLKGKLEEFVTR
jgi:pyruvate dehydrogenase (quinone)